MKYLLPILLLAGCTNNSPPGEFVCYKDNVLNERHVGVKGAHIWNDNGYWEINYIEGSPKHTYYLQERGESCHVER